MIFAVCSSKKNWLWCGVSGGIGGQNYEVGQQLGRLEYNRCGIMSTAQENGVNKGRKKDNGE
jgi:hypothetical protein